ncbi:TetR/AcrR family transcriptional regulator [Streptomyces sp. NBC_01190]|uniref:TetR/AcrR family transcriptional regulator n=1 Tax=Streptomyces sp. NBC_01190 TaxID=2903767 RepID=UPI003868DC06|nr:TetR/AcrR family transcriptional regulator [Streptomyces sp. NBC_01190]
MPPPSDRVRLPYGACFTELSVERIAAEAGLSRSTFYLYFRDKTELILRLAESLKAGTFEAGEDWDPDRPEDGLAWLTDAYHRIVRGDRARSATLAAILEVAGYDRAVRAMLEANQRRFMERMAARLADEQRAGRAGGGMDPLLAASLMIWGGEQAIATYVINTVADEERDARMAHELAASHWNGIYRRPAGTAPSPAADPAR